MNIYINMEKLFIFVWVLGVIIAPLCAANIIKNPSFENGSPGKAPKNWCFRVSRNAAAKMQITDKEAKIGKHSLKIVNESSIAPNVFGTISQSVKLDAGQKYTVSAWIKGEEVHSLIFIIGNQWKIRFYPKNISNEWKLFKFEFTADQKDFNKKGLFPIRINIDNTCRECYIDNFSVYPSAGKQVNADKYQENRVYLLKKTEWSGTAKMLPLSYPRVSIPQNGTQFSGKKLPIRKDLFADFALAYSEKGIIFTAKVSDDKIVTRDKKNMWRGDCVQLAIDQDCSLRKGGLEISMGLDKKGEGQAFCTQIGMLPNDEIEIKAKKTQEGYLIAALLKWKLLSLIDKDRKKAFSFNIVLNENDGNAREVAFLAPGIHKEKSSIHNTIALFQNNQLACQIIREDGINWKDLKSKLLFYNKSSNASEEAQFILTDSKGKIHKKKITIPVTANLDDIIITEFKMSLSEVSSGPYQMQMLVNGVKLATATGTKKNISASIKEFINTVKNEITLAESLIKKKYGEKTASRYLTVPIFELKRQVLLLERDLKKGRTNVEKHFYLDRARRIIVDMKEAVQILKNSLKQMDETGFPETWLYKTSEIKLDGGWFNADTVNEQGLVKRSDLLFTGYGHFGDVISDMPYFKKIAADIVQIEIGPSHYLTKTGFNKKRLNNYIFRGLKRASENNIAVCVLLSPHYFPKWLLEKHPDLKRMNGFLKYEVNHPVAKATLKRYFPNVIRDLKNSEYSKTIQSICITNEPVYQSCRLDNEFTRNEFIKYLKAEYKNISDFNSLTGENFKSFIEATHVDIEKNKAVKYEFHTFKRRSFAEWHKWLADMVRREWPNMPISSKIMVSSSLWELDHGVDAEQFSNFSDLNGNDNFMKSNNYKNSKYASNWVGISLSHDLQMSMKKTSVLNSENHIIADGESDSIPFNHIYTAIFQQYMQGVGGIITWVWTNNDYSIFKKVPSLRNNIYRRANSVIAQAYACLDGNRLVNDIVAFCKADPNVAILYSPTSFILNTTNYCYTNKKIYEHLSFTGYKIGYLSEKQLQNGIFKKVKVLILPEVKNIERKTLDGLYKFIAAGGEIISVGNCLKEDQYGHKLEFTSKTGYINEKFTGNQLVSQLNNILKGKINLPIEMHSTSKDAMLGVQWRTVNVNKKYYINIVNYNKTVKKIVFRSKQKFNAVDLISGKNISREFQLKPLEPMLIKVHFSE